MDPLLLEALEFGLAILAGGLVAIIAQRIAFRDARVLERERDRLTAARLRRALVAELRENVRRLDSIDWAAVPAVTLVSTAWHDARGLEDVGADLFDAIAAAHAAGVRAHDILEYVASTLVRPPIVRDREELGRVVAETVLKARREVEASREAFARALEALGERPEVEI